MTALVAVAAGHLVAGLQLRLQPKKNLDRAGKGRRAAFFAALQFLDLAFERAASSETRRPAASAKD